MLKYVINSRTAIGLLFVFALALFPATATESKYVWKDTKTLNLTVSYGNTIITSLSYTDGSGEYAADNAASNSDTTFSKSFSASNTASTTDEDSVSANENVVNGVTPEELPVQDESDEVIGKPDGLDNLEQLSKVQE